MLTFVMLIPCNLANTKKIISFNYKSNLTNLHFGRGQLTSTRCLRNIWSVEIDTNITYMIIQCSFLRIRLETNFVRLLKVKHQFYGHIRVAFFKSFHLICDMIIKLCEISQIFAMRNFAFSPKFRRNCEISHAKNAKFRKAFRFRNANFAMRNFAFSHCENFRKNPTCKVNHLRGKF